MKAKKRELRLSVQEMNEEIPREEHAERSNRVADRLYDFANFVESKTILLYWSMDGEVDTRPIIRHCLDIGKIVLLPALNVKQQELVPFKIDDMDKDLREGFGGRMEPDPRRCKLVPHKFVDLGIIQGVAFDERGGRLGTGDGLYDRLIPRLPVTTRKVALALESQLVNQVPMESHDKYVDIIITEDRIIYKI
ncbi:MAG: 5-formyltetrahydrofolate cyclo-ligase [Desulfatibacillaceae bacterium]